MPEKERVAEWITNIYALLIACLVGTGLLGFAFSHEWMIKLVVAGVLCGPIVAILVVVAVDREPWQAKAFGMGTLLVFLLGIVLALR